MYKYIQQLDQKHVFPFQLKKTINADSVSGL